MSNVVAIDGLVASGKGTTSKGVAKKLGRIYMDTGSMYRGVSYYLLTNNIACNNEQKVSEVVKEISFSYSYNDATDHYDIFCNEENIESKIRDVTVSSRIPLFVHMKEVRAHLADQQRAIAAKCEGVVADGRDMGTVVFPDAVCKVFMICDASVRAERRYSQIAGTENNASMTQIRDDIRSRDNADYLHGDAVNSIAADAHILDGTLLSVEEQVDSIVLRTQSALTKKK